MPDWIHRTNLNMLASVAEADLPEAAANFIQDPDLAAVTGHPKRHWEISGNDVVLKSQAERDAIDAAIITNGRIKTADRLDEVEEIERALALAILDEFNVVRSALEDVKNAIENASNLAGIKTAVAALPNLSDRTIAQLKTAVLNKLGT